MLTSILLLGSLLSAQAQDVEDASADSIDWHQQLKTTQRSERRGPTAAGARWTAASATAMGWGLSALANDMDSGPVAVVGIPGVFAGPSMGHFTSGEWGRGLLSTSLRVGAFAVIVPTLAYEHYCLADPDYVDQGWNDRGNCARSWTTLMAGWGSVALFVGSTGFDIWDAGRAPQRAAKRREARAERRTLDELALSPTLLLNDDDAPAPGLALTGRW